MENIFKKAEKIRRKKIHSFFFQFLIPSLRSPSLDCACLMSWHLVFHFSSPHSSTPALPLRAHTGSSCVSFSSPSNVLPAGAHNASRKDRKEKKKDHTAMFFFFFDNQSISHSLSPIFRAKGGRAARGGAIVEQCGRCNNGANKSKKFAQVGGSQTWAHALKKEKKKKTNAYKKANLAFQFKRKNSFNQEPPS